ncbi:glycosyltransferase [Streptomyces sp. NPDC097619]|uniref:glycosyltransferase n=1 Tax=Streptomyces sp. NPDC097619 TaxID=3157228 RepID=UPI00332D2E04
MPRVVIISPPFRSHAAPLSVLAAALRERGANVFFACTEAFEDLAVETGTRFVPLAVTRNANTGIAETTAQERGEALRLAEFLDATRRGAVPALVLQARHRRADMLAEPEAVLARLRELDARVRPDWYLVDQLAYSATLGLHCLRARYATYCPGHPTYVPAAPGLLFGVPYDWPAAVRPDPSALIGLEEAARDNDHAFTELFASFVRANAPGAPVPGRAFALTSPHAVLYAYPQLPWLPPVPTGPEHVFAGHMTGNPPPLDHTWSRILSRLRRAADRVVLVALGTFLSARDDVLRTVVSGTLRQATGTGTAVIVAAGGRTAALADLADERVVIVPSVPQQALLPYVDAMVHHGGNNSFTECLRSGVPALLLPFSSDQFAIARDAERLGVGLVRDPNALRPDDVPQALETLRTVIGPATAGRSRGLDGLGPGYAAARLLEVMDRQGSGRPAAPGGGRPRP